MRPAVQRGLGVKGDWSASVDWDMAGPLTKEADLSWIGDR
jgi:hypothetical protein